MLLKLRHNSNILEVFFNSIKSKTLSRQSVFAKIIASMLHVSERAHLSDLKQSWDKHYEQYLEKQKSIESLLKDLAWDLPEQALKEIDRIVFRNTRNTKSIDYTENSRRGYYRERGL